MTISIGQYVLAGELRNTRRNSVFGWIEFAPDYGLRIELTGNFPGEYSGKHLRFRARRDGPPPNTDDLPAEIYSLADRQIGVFADLRIDANTIVMNWFSQDGPIHVELDDVELRFVEPGEETGQGNSSLADGYAELVWDENGIVSTNGLEQFDDEEEDESDEDGEEDPFGLFSDDLDSLLAESLDTDGETDGLPELDSGEEFNWQALPPGIDPESDYIYKQLDEIVKGDKDEPVTYLFEKPLKLPKPKHVKSDDEAQQYVIAILAQLARLNVALDVCEHFSPQDTYRLLMEEILPTAKVHPNLAQSEMVQHFSTSDVCPICEAELDSEMDDSAENSSSDDASSQDAGESNDQPDSDEDEGA